MTPRYLESYFEILSYHLKVVTKNEVTSFTFYFLIPYSMTSAVGKVTKGQKSVVSSMQLMWQLLESRPSEIAQSCPTVCNPMDCSLPHSSVHGIFPGKSTGVGCQILLQRIFPTQGSNPGLPHCRQTLYHLSHKGTPHAPTHTTDTPHMLPTPHPPTHHTPTHHTQPHLHHTQPHPHHTQPHPRHIGIIQHKCEDKMALRRRTWLHRCELKSCHRVRENGEVTWMRTWHLEIHQLESLFHFPKHSQRCGEG